MPFLGRTAAHILVTPQDEQADPGLCERLLRFYMTHCTGPLAFSEFGAQWEAFWESLGTHIDAGRRVLGVLDLTQFSGPSEQKVAHPFLLSHPAPFQAQDIVVGHELTKSAIVHDKKIVFNAPIYGYVPTVGDWDTPQEALLAGGCVSWWGSLNLSAGASNQANTFGIFPGVVLGTMFTTDIQKNHDDIARTEQRYQPFPKTTAA